MEWRLVFSLHLINIVCSSGNHNIYDADVNSVLKPAFIDEFLRPLSQVEFLRSYAAAQNVFPPNLPTGPGNTSAEIGDTKKGPVELEPFDIYNLNKLPPNLDSKSLSSPDLNRDLHESNDALLSIYDHLYGNEQFYNRDDKDSWEFEDSYVNSDQTLHGKGELCFGNQCKPIGISDDLNDHVNDRRETLENSTEFPINIHGNLNYFDLDIDDLPIIYISIVPIFIEQDSNFNTHLSVDPNEDYSVTDRKVTDLSIKGHSVVTIQHPLKMENKAQNYVSETLLEADVDDKKQRVLIKKDYYEMYPLKDGIERNGLLIETPPPPVDSDLINKSVTKRSLNFGHHSRKLDHKPFNHRLNTKFRNHDSINYHYKKLVQLMYPSLLRNPNLSRHIRKHKSSGNSYNRKLHSHRHRGTAPRYLNSRKFFAGIDKR